MARLVITERANADVSDIILYLRENAGLQVAERYRVEFDAAYDRLTAFPATGSPRSSLGRRARLVLVHPYVIVYDHVGDMVTVLRILHGKRNITRRLVRQREP